MTKIEQKKSKKSTWIAIGCLAALYVLLFLLDNFLPSNSFTVMLIPVLRKGAIYSLLCVSMNLLNGFTGLFSLGQAGFMLIGAYTYSIFTIPTAERLSVYQYFDGGVVQFSFSEAIGNVLGPTAGAMPGLRAFVAAVFGGIGSIPGAVIGAFVIGICENLIKGAGWTTFSDAFTFVLLIVILLAKPTGIFGEKATDKV